MKYIISQQFTGLTIGCEVHKKVSNLYWMDLLSLSATSPENACTATTKNNTTTNCKPNPVLYHNCCEALVDIIQVLFHRKQIIGYCSSRKQSQETNQHQQLYLPSG